MKADESDLILLKAQIRRLNLDLEKKDHEINVYIEKIHDNEEEIIQLQEVISKRTSGQDLHKIIDSKMKFEIKEKEREIRDLKNRMGFLRQEKTMVQKELEEFKMINKSTAISVDQIRMEEKLNNLEVLINELRRKLYRQETLNSKLKDEIRQKENEINDLQLLMSELRQGLKVQNSILEGKFFKEKIKKELNKELKKELNESKKRIDTLRNQLTKYKEPERDILKYKIEIHDLKNKIIHLKKELDKKDKLINKLKSKN